MTDLLSPKRIQVLSSKLSRSEAGVKNLAAKGRSRCAHGPIFTERVRRDILH